MARIHILVGSVTGKALSAAEAINAVYNEYQHQSTVFISPSIEQVKDESIDVLVIVTSTCGQGDLPPSISPLYEELQDQLPLIPNKKFAIVALGDSSYSTFCQGGMIMEAQMLALHGQVMCDRFNIDAVEHFIPIDAARQWALDCLTLL
jgi:MioC protein